jgi:hypothetical protein
VRVGGSQHSSYGRGGDQAAVPPAKLRECEHAGAVAGQESGALRLPKLMVRAEVAYVHVFLAAAGRGEEQAEEDQEVNTEVKVARRIGLVVCGLMQRSRGPGSPLLQRGGATDRSRRMCRRWLVTRANTPWTRVGAECPVHTWNKGESEWRGTQNRTGTPFVQDAGTL